MKEGATVKIIQRFTKHGGVHFGQIDGHKKHIITADVGQKLIEYVEEKPDSTLVEMKTYLADNDCTASLPTISRFLSGKLIAMKLLRIASQCEAHMREILIQRKEKKIFLRQLNY